MSLEKPYISPDVGMLEIKHAYRQMAVKWYSNRTFEPKGKACPSAIDMFSEGNNAYHQSITRHLSCTNTNAIKENAMPPIPAPISQSSMSSLNSSQPSRCLARRQLSLRPSDHLSASSRMRRSSDITVNLSNTEASSEVMHCSKWATLPSRPYCASDSPFLPNKRAAVINHMARLGLPSKSNAKPHYEATNLNALLSGPPLQWLGIGTHQEWVYSLTLTLEELFFGKICRFCIVRQLLSGKSKNVMLEINVPPGCQTGTKIMCRGVGHELSPKKFQDVILVVDEAPHDFFFRNHDNLFVDIRLNWPENVRQQLETIYTRGIDGEEISIPIDRTRNRTTRGSLCVTGAGMPVTDGGKVRSRGDLIVRWEIQPLASQTKLRQILHRLFRYPKPL